MPPGSRSQILALEGRELRELGGFEAYPGNSVGVFVGASSFIGAVLGSRSPKVTRGVASVRVAVPGGHRKLLPRPGVPPERVRPQQGQAPEEHVNRPYGSRSFSIRSARSEMVRVKLSNHARRKLSRRRTVKAVAVIQTRDAGGNRKGRPRFG